MEYVIRAIAWLIPIKCLPVFFLSDILPWWIELITTHPYVSRCMGIFNLLFGFLMFCLARNLMRQPPQGDNLTPE